MPGPKGVITGRGDQKIAYACDRKCLELVDELPIRGTNTVNMQVKSSRPKMTPKPSDQIKEVQLDGSASPEGAKILVGAGLDLKYEESLVSFL